MAIPAARKTCGRDVSAERKSPTRSTTIYVLCCPREGSVRYIGKADDSRKRLLGHIADAASGRSRGHHGNWVRSLLRDGLAPIACDLFRVPVGMRWQDAERFFIAAAQSFGFALTNGTSGGEGLRLVHEEDRSRHAAVMKAVQARPEVQAKKRAYFDAPSTRQKRSEQGKRLAADPEIRAKKSRALKQHFGTPEERAKFSAKWRELWAKPEYAERKSAASKAAWADPEAAARRRAAMSEGKRQGWARKKAAMKAAAC